MTKRCNGCGQELPLEEFSRNILARDGLQFQCRACKSRHKRKHPKNQMRKNQNHREQTRPPRRTTIKDRIECKHSTTEILQLYARMLAGRGAKTPFHDIGSKYRQEAGKKERQIDEVVDTLAQHWGKFSQYKYFDVNLIANPLTR
jgi:hypothetical protein